MATQVGSIGQWPPGAHPLKSTHQGPAEGLLASLRKGRPGYIELGPPGPPTSHIAPPSLLLVTSGLQVHEDWGPERPACLGPPHKEFIRCGQLFPWDGHPVLPEGYCHSPGSVGMTVRREVGIGGVYIVMDPSHSNNFSAWVQISALLL